MELTRNGFSRIVVTGMGTITPLGVSSNGFWNSLVAGKSGIRKIQAFDASDLRVQIAGEVDFDASQYLDKRDYKRMARCSQIAQVTARFAVEDAGLTPEELHRESERIGVVMGVGQGGYEVGSASNLRFSNEGRRPRPLELINVLPNMPAYYAGREIGATGPLSTIIAACASGTQSVGEAMRYLREGRADMMLAGGVEALIQDYILEGMASMTVLTTEFNDDPTAASRPFDKDRSGFVFAEGSGVMVLETLEHALARDANIHAEILGYGLSSDAFHITSPDESGAGAVKAMKWAMQDAQVNLEDIDYINAHGTSTPVNDAMETLAIKKVFGNDAYNIPISSTKSMIGHLLGASGTVEAIASVYTLQTNTIHPTINYTTPDPECDLDYVPNEARQQEVNTILSNSFGFGGQNACLVLGKFE